MSMRQCTIRINEDASRALDYLVSRVESDPVLFERLIRLDRKRRIDYRNYSGRKPQPQTLVARHALQIGLAILAHADKGNEMIAFRKDELI